MDGSVYFRNQCYSRLLSFNPISKPKTNKPVTKLTPKVGRLHWIQSRALMSGNTKRFWKKVSDLWLSVSLIKSFGY